MTTTPNHAGSATALTKEEWITRATARLQPYLDDGSREYAETLYQDFVEGFGGDWGADPEGAVFEDMGNWDASE
jgi:hypothetical protein